MAATVEPEVRRILVEHLGVEPSAVTTEKRLAEDLGADSLDEIALVMATEEIFAIELADDEVMEVRTVADLNELVRRKLAARDGA